MAQVVAYFWRVSKTDDRENPMYYDVMRVICVTGVTHHSLHIYANVRKRHITQTVGPTNTVT